MNTIKYVFITLLGLFVATLCAVTDLPIIHLVFSLVMFAVIYLFYREDRPFPKYKLSGKDILVVLIGIVVIFILDNLLIYILPNPVEEQHTKVLLQNYGLYGILLACVVAPITEEYIFRYIPTNKPTIIVSVFLFGLFHTQVSQNIYTAFYPAIVTAMNAVAFHLFYRKTDNLYVSIFIHASMNLIALGL